MQRIQVEKLASLAGHKESIFTLAPGMEKDEILSAGGDGMVVIWNLNDISQGKMLARVSSSIYALHRESNSPMLYVGQNNDGIHKINLEEKKIEGAVHFTKAPIFDIQQKGTLLFASDGKGTLFKLNDGLELLGKVRYASQSARCVAVHPEGKELAVGYSDNKIRVLSVENLEVLHEIAAHENSVFTISYSPDGRFLLSGSRDAHLKIWDTAKDYALHESIVAHMYAINHLAYHPSGAYFATCSMDKSIKIWDATNFQLLKVIDKARHAGHGTSVNKLMWLPDGKRLLSASDDRTVSVWDIALDTTVQ